MLQHLSYTLEPYNGQKSRYRCPGCQKNRQFTRYINSETGECLPDHVGICNRKDKCGYSYTAKQYFEDLGQPFGEEEGQSTKQLRKGLRKKILQPSYIPTGTFTASLKDYNQNHFITFLNSVFGKEATELLIARYFIGTSKLWPGATVFWQVDGKGKVRTGKIMLYSPTTGKRVKEPYNHISWAHKALNFADFNLMQGFFGEHLLAESSLPVAIVESEKTAIIASYYFPSFLWLAVGSLTNLSEERCQVLAGRTGALFPDLNAYEKWKEKAEQVPELSGFTVSTLLEENASKTEREQGLDLADYLINMDPKTFKETGGKKPAALAESVWPKPTERERPKAPVLSQVAAVEAKPQEAPEVRFPAPTQEKFPAFERMEELEQFFLTAHLPAEPIKLNQCSTITNLKAFISGHLATVKANKGKRIALPYLERLIQVKEILQRA